MKDLGSRSPICGFVAGHGGWWSESPFNSPRRGFHMAGAGVDVEELVNFCDSEWEESIIPSLSEYIRIPALSPAFDSEWYVNGHIEDAIQHIASWCSEQPIKGLKLQIIRLEGRTPLIHMHVPGQIDETVLLYQHADKQPEFVGWFEGLGPWEPVRRGDKLYGRGGADDGYGAYASLTAIRGLQRQGIPHGNLHLIVEASEESGSPDLPAYLDHLEETIGVPSVVVCLDSGAGDWEHLWLTTSLRGLVIGTLSIKVSEQGVHSGDAGGVIPSSFRIARSLLERIEDSSTGEILIPEFNVEIPEQRIEQAKEAAGVMGEEVWKKFPFKGDTRPPSDDMVELILNRTWRPSLEVTGVEGIPDMSKAGNVLRTNTDLKLSCRIPAGVDSKKAAEVMKRLLEAEPPHGADVNFNIEMPADGFHAKPLSPWISEALDGASRAYFGNPLRFMGEGGTIPFMPMLQTKYPQAEFMITGLLGPQSNAHGPNEFTHIPCGKAVTACVAQVLAAHAAHHLS